MSESPFFCCCGQIEQMSCQDLKESENVIMWQGTRVLARASQAIEMKKSWSDNHLKNHVFWHVISLQEITRRNPFRCARLERMDFVLKIGRNMNIEQLRQRAAEMRASLFEQGVLNSYFLQLEHIEEGRPNFVENIIGTYISQSTFFLNQLRQALQTSRLDLQNVERLIMKLKGGSSTIGAARFNAIVCHMCDVFKRGEFFRLYDEFQRVCCEHAFLKLQLQPYAEILHMVRKATPPAPPAPAEGSVSSGETESTASNYMEE